MTDARTTARQDALNAVAADRVDGAPATAGTPSTTSTTGVVDASLPAITDPGGLITPAGTAQLLGSLLLVLGLIVALGWLSRRLHRFSPGTRNRALRMLDVLPVGTRERIALIEAGGQQLLIGLAPGRVQTLHVLEKPIDTLRDSAATGDRQPTAGVAARPEGRLTDAGAGGPASAPPGFARILSRMSR
jgi:flagellar protein FliO/FliZ